MDYKEIRDLASLMREMNLTSLEYEDSDYTIKLHRAIPGEPEAASVPAEPGLPRAQRASGDISNVGIDKTPELNDLSVKSFTIKSPMVGVFYAAPASDAEPFVKEGDRVRSGDILCIIEAMKIMNEITAERDGVILEVCAMNKDIVEYNQPLFRVGADVN